MQVDLEGLYGKILQELKKESRPQVKLTREDWSDLALLFKQYIQERQIENLLKILCILNNCQSAAPALLFTEGLLDLLEGGDENSQKNKDILIFSLAALGKHTIPLHQRNGDKLPPRLIKSLRKLLTPQSISHSHPEVLVWTLRTVEEIGGQGLALKEDIKKVSFGLFSFTNPHLRSAKKIIAGLLKKWSSFY